MILLLPLFVVAAGMLAAILFAIQQGASGRALPDQSRRILIPAAAAAVLTGLYMSGFALFESGIIMLVLGIGVLFGAFSLVIAVVDISARALGAVRTQRWLAAGIVIGVTVTFCCLAAIAAALGGQLAILGLVSPVGIGLFCIGASAALLWWSHLPLPLPKGDLVERFK